MATAARKLRKKGPASTTVAGKNVFMRRVDQIPKLSQEGLARKAGVSVETLRLLEASRDPSKPQQSPHLDTLDKIAAALGTDTSTLLKQQDSPSKPTGERDRSHLALVPKTGTAT